MNLGHLSCQVKLTHSIRSCNNGLRESNWKPQWYNNGGRTEHFELNVFKPLIIHNILQSIEIMSDSAKTFGLYCVKGIKADKRIKYLLDNSLMLVTALAPKIGYDNAAKIAKMAHKNGTTLKEEVIKTKLINEKEYDILMNPIKMTKPK